MEWLQHYQLYALIPEMRRKTVLPDEGFTRRLLPVGREKDGREANFLVRCEPKPRKGVKRHRVLVLCDCGREIPFGRMTQHYPKCVMAQS